jgi:hypothetical protein
VLNDPERCGQLPNEAVLAITFITPGNAQSAQHLVEVDHTTAKKRRAAHPTATNSAATPATKPGCLLTGVCRHGLLDLGFHPLEVETCASLHRRELDGGLGDLRHLLLDELEAPELVREPIIIG